MVVEAGDNPFGARFDPLRRSSRFFFGKAPDMPTKHRQAFSRNPEMKNEPNAKENKRNLGMLNWSTSHLKKT